MDSRPRGNDNYGYVSVASGFSRLRGNDNYEQALAAFQIMGRPRHRRAGLGDVAQGGLDALDFQPDASPAAEHQIDGAAAVFFPREFDGEPHSHRVPIVLPDSLRL